MPTGPNLTAMRVSIVDHAPESSTTRVVPEQEIARV
jgi:hypothetical protein